MTGNVTRVPLAYFSLAPHVSFAVRAGSSPWTASFQASNCFSAAIVSDGGAAPVNVPITEMPVLPVLNPYT